MTEELAANGWEICADIIEQFDMRDRPDVDREQAEVIDKLCVEMRMNAGRIRSEATIIDAHYGKLTTPTDAR